MIYINVKAPPVWTSLWFTTTRYNYAYWALESLYFVLEYLYISLSLYIYILWAPWQGNVFIHLQVYFTQCLSWNSPKEGLRSWIIHVKMNQNVLHNSDFRLAFYQTVRCLYQGIYFMCAIRKISKAVMLVYVYLQAVVTDLKLKSCEFHMKKYYLI